MYNVLIRRTLIVISAATVITSCTVNNNTGNINQNKMDPGISVSPLFSPDGDGQNDKWSISGLEPHEHTELFVYSRFGELVYQIKGKYEPWDGKYQGRDIPSGSYYYILLPGKARKITGWLAIQRERSRVKRT